MTQTPLFRHPPTTTAGAENTSAIARVLAAAFYDDPAGKWLAPDPVTRQTRLTRFFEVEARSFTVPHGEVTMAGDVAAALWLPPGRWRIPPLVLLRTLPRLGRIFGGRTPLLLRGLSLIEHEHPRAPHWYLPFIGVVPSHQGRGIGSALLQSVLQRCDADGLPAYLEASSERNRELYLRHGFMVTKEVDLPEGPPLWLMWREPRGDRP